MSIRSLVGLLFFLSTAVFTPVFGGEFVLRGELADVARPALRVVTYNLRSGLGTGFGFGVPPERVQKNLTAIADTIHSACGQKDATVDLVALNEVDFGSRRTGWIDQAQFLADALRRRTGHVYTVVRGETWRRDFPGREVRFGNAALVRHPILDAFACPILSDGGCERAPGDDRRPGPLARLIAEPRGVVRVTFQSPLGEIDAVVTHLDPFLRGVREAQAARVLAGFVDPRRTTLVLGDMNALAPVGRDTPTGDRTYTILTGVSLEDARVRHATNGGTAPTGFWATFPSIAPVRAIDWVLATRDLVPGRLSVIGGDASDHRGFFVRYERAP